MKTHVKIIPVLLFIICISTTAFAGQYKATRVYDGDTILCVGNDATIKVRLVGIDAPETSKNKRDPGQPYSQQAKKYLTSLVLNKVVDIKGYGLDQYNRVLGAVSLGGKDINLEMIKEGLAEVYRGKPPKEFKSEPYFEVEKEAKGSSKGMWSLGNKYISPREWRKKKSKSENY
jgi:micrococcal nuclease